MRIAWLGLGLVATGCGIAGIVLPLVPITPFLLLAACAFARSSPTLHEWLVTHPRFGPLIAHWRLHGAIGRRTKVRAVVVIVVMLLASWIGEIGPSLLVLQTDVLALASLVILTRPDGLAETGVTSEWSPSRSLERCMSSLSSSGSAASRWSRSFSCRAFCAMCRSRSASRSSR